jgi:hypothetical protein
MRSVRKGTNHEKNNSIYLIVVGMDLNKKFEKWEGFYNFIVHMEL